MSKIKMKMVEETPTLRTKVDEFFTAKQLAGICEKSMKTYKGKLDVCFKDINLDTQISDVDWNQIIRNVYSRNISEASKFSYLAGLRNFMNWLDMGLPLPKIKKIDTIKETYTNDELKILLRKPEKSANFTEWRTYTIEMLVCDCGLRAGSIRNILIKDVDIDNCLLYIRHVKMNKVQTVPFSKTTQVAIKRILDVHKRTEGYSPDNYLFSNVYGSKMSENSLRLSVARYNRKRGISKTSIHALRHTFAKRWLTECGGNVFTLKQLLGHSRIEMSEHYARLYDNQLQELYKSPVELLSKTQIKMNQIRCF